MALLRLLAWAAQAGAAWIFFCLFQRTLGIAAAALGALCLLAAANMTGLHAAALPNHFAMAMAAFACLVAGLRGCAAAHCAGRVARGRCPLAGGRHARGLPCFAPAWRCMCGITHLLDFYPLGDHAQHDSPLIGSSHVERAARVTAAQIECTGGQGAAPQGPQMDWRRTRP